MISALPESGAWQPNTLGAHVDRPRISFISPSFSCPYPLPPRSGPRWHAHRSCAFTSSWSGRTTFSWTGWSLSYTRCELNARSSGSISVCTNSLIQSSFSWNSGSVEKSQAIVNPSSSSSAPSQRRHVHSLLPRRRLRLGRRQRHLAPDQLVALDRRQHVAVEHLAVRAVALWQVADDDAPLGPAVPAVHHRVPRHRGNAVVHVADRAFPVRIERRLHALSVRGPDDTRLRRVEAVHVLRHVHADTAHEAVRPGIAAQHVRHGRDRVGHVVAAGAAVVWQPAGDRQQARVAIAETERVTGEVH